MQIPAPPVGWKPGDPIDFSATAPQGSTIQQKVTPTQKESEKAPEKIPKDGSSTGNDEGRGKKRKADTSSEESKNSEKKKPKISLGLDDSDSDSDDSDSE